MHEVAVLMRLFRITFGNKGGFIDLMNLGKNQSMASGLCANWMLRRDLGQLSTPLPLRRVFQICV